jgi:hypothetical protein
VQTHATRQWHDVTVFHLPQRVLFYGQILAFQNTLPVLFEHYPEYHRL